MANSVRPQSKAAPEKRVSVAECCRQVAGLVDGVMPEIVSSFASADPEVRASQLSAYGNELLTAAFPFLTWLERTKHPDSANLERRRIFQVADEAVACAASDLPHLAGGQLGAHEDKRLTPAEMRLGELVVVTMHEGASLRNWAEQIETEEVTDWLTVTEAATASGATKPEISKAANRGELVANGKTRRDRRISKASLVEWQLRRAMKAERNETDAAVQRRLRRAERD